MATETVKRHPIRGFLYGIPFGLGLAMIAVGQKWAALGTWPPFIIFLVGIAISMVWSTFGPAKGPKGEPPTASDDAPEPDADPDTVVVVEELNVEVTADADTGSGPGAAEGGAEGDGEGGGDDAGDVEENERD